MGAGQDSVGSDGARPGTWAGRFLVGGLVAYLVGAPVASATLTCFSSLCRGCPARLPFFPIIWFFALAVFPVNALSVLAGGVVNVASPALHPHFGPIAYAIAGAAFGAVATFAQAAAGFGNGTVAGNREFFAAYAVAGAADGFVLRLVPRRRERRAGHSYGNQGP